MGESGREFQVRVSGLARPEKEPYSEDSRRARVLLTHLFMDIGEGSVFSSFSIYGWERLRFFCGKKKQPP